MLTAGPSGSGEAPHELGPRDPEAGADPEHLAIVHVTHGRFASMPADETPSAPDWIAAFAARLGTEPPDQQTIDQLLELAGVAAHSSERVAAPIACWLVGRAHVSPAAALDAARAVGA